MALARHSAHECRAILNQGYLENPLASYWRCDSLTRQQLPGALMSDRRGIFDVEERLAQLARAGDPLLWQASVVDFATVREEPVWALSRPSHGSRKPTPTGRSHEAGKNRNSAATRWMRRRSAPPRGCSSRCSWTAIRSTTRGAKHENWLLGFREPLSVFFHQPCARLIGVPSHAGS